jgi:hypothetical protein
MKERQRGGSHFLSKHKKGHRRKLLHKVLQEWLISWFREIKTNRRAFVSTDRMNRRAFVSTDRMRAGHSSLKASISRFNIVPTAEYECGDRLLTEEHVFWDLNCRRTKGQQWWVYCLRKARIKEYLKSVTELLRPEGKIFVKEVCYFINRTVNFVFWNK